MTSLVLYTEQPMLEEGVKAIIAAAGGFQLLDSRADICALVDLFTAEKPDMALIELSPHVTIESIRALRSACSATSIVLWTGSGSGPFLYDAFNIGVRGILDRSLPVATQVQCLRDVAAGKLWIEPEMSRRFICAKKICLTPRECDLMGLIAQGLRNKEIAWRLNISEGTVKVYFSRLFTKLGVTDRLELALVALKHYSSSDESNADAPGSMGNEEKPFSIFLTMPKGGTLRMLPGDGSCNQAATKVASETASLLALSAALDDAPAARVNKPRAAVDRPPRLPVFHPEAAPGVHYENATAARTSRPSARR